MLFRSKAEKSSNSNKCKVFYSELWGSEYKKLNSLDCVKIEDLVEIQLNSMYEFVPNLINEQKNKIYEDSPSLNDIFIQSASPITTKHDSFICHPDKNILKQIVNNYFNRDYFQKEIHDQDKEIEVTISQKEFNKLEKKNPRIIQKFYLEIGRASCRERV